MHKKIFEDGDDAASPDESDGGRRRELLREGQYTAFVEDLGFMWRWTIHRGSEMCQEGCSLSEASSHEAVRHVLAFYTRREQSAAALAEAT